MTAAPAPSCHRPKPAPTAWTTAPGAARPARLALLLAALFLLCAGPLALGADNDDLLATQRWHENGYGISLRPPLGARMVQRNVDDAILHILGDGDTYTINLFIRKSNEALSLDKLNTLQIDQLGLHFPGARLLEQKPIKIGGRDAELLYARIPDPNRGDWVTGQAFVIIQSDTYALLEVNTRPAALLMTKDVFEAVIHSIQFQNLNQINNERIQMVELGTQWHEKLKPVDIQQAMIAQQWLRILQNNNDVGYMKVVESTGTETGVSGIQVDVQSHMELIQPGRGRGTSHVDSTAHFFLSTSGQTEIWKIKTVAHYPRQEPNPQALGLQHLQVDDEANTVAEAATRSGTQIVLSRETAGVVRQYHWDLALERDIPDEDPKFVERVIQKVRNCYLSQVELYLLPRLLPSKTTPTMGFYAYNPNVGKLVFRTERVESNPDGSYTIYSRPTPESAEQVSRYDAAGLLIRRELPGGQVIVPASRDEVRLRWSVE